ncbi:MAG: hypothetical protein JW940_02160 [Polyangiaceae bacterium]|nr:hypothetical protein [Polyangiaceae bacterium]
MARGLSLRAALLPSVLLHAAVLGALLLAVRGHRVAPRAPGPVKTVDVALEMDLVALGSTKATVESAPPEPAVAAARRTADRAGAPLSSSSASVVARAAPFAPDTESRSAARGGNEATSSVGRARSPRRHLSLEALGVTPGAHMAWDLPTEARPSPAERRQQELDASQQRLARSMQQLTIEQDGKIGLGPQGPILRALSREAVGSLAAAPSYAVVLARIDDKGTLTLHLVEANRDYEHWAAMTRRAQVALASTTLRPPAGARGLELEIRLDVRNQLPSGADPGLGVDLLGIPIQRGKGDRSAKLKLLEPKLEVDEVEVPTPSGGTVKLPELAIGIVPFGLDADPSDLGAKAQRMVSVQVTRQTAL